MPGHLNMSSQLASWNEEKLQQAMSADRGGMAVLAIFKEYGIPRRTIRNRITTESIKKLESKSVLTEFFV